MTCCDVLRGILAFCDVIRHMTINMRRGLAELLRDASSCEVTCCNVIRSFYLVYRVLCAAPYRIALWFVILVCAVSPCAVLCCTAMFCPYCDVTPACLLCCSGDTGRRGRMLHVSCRSRAAPPPRAHRGRPARPSTSRYVTCYYVT